jgi:hypothetical protein
MAMLHRTAVSQCRTGEQNIAAAKITVVIAFILYADGARSGFSHPPLAERPDGSWSVREELDLSQKAQSKSPAEQLRGRHDSVIF